MKYGPEVQERAYELRMLEGLSTRAATQKMRETWPKFDYRLLRKWEADPVLDWNGRYAEHRRKLAAKSDEARLKAMTPIMEAVQTVREELYQKVIGILRLKDGQNPVNEKNLAQVLRAFNDLCDMELRRIGGGPDMRKPLVEVIEVIFMVIERTPNVGPVFKAHRREIVDAVYEIIEEKKE